MNFAKKYIDYLLIKRNEETVENNSQRYLFRASGIGLCERLNVYRAIRTERKFCGNPESMALPIGTSIHEIVQNDLMNAGLIRNIRDENGKPGEIAFDRPDLQLTGHCDGVYDLPNGGIGLFELKTANSHAYEAIVVYNKKPTKKHIMQANLYAGLLGAKEITVCYINKNGAVSDKHKEVFARENYNPFITSYTLPFDEEMFNQALDKLARMRKYVENKELPPKISDNQCSYCDYLWTCKPKTYNKIMGKKEGAGEKQVKKSPKKSPSAKKKKETTGLSILDLMNVHEHNQNLDF